jgi:glyoxylase-like metal-dependent hydrolase (beta-lactamase superfamily II)
MKTISSFCKKLPAVLTAAIAVSVLPVGLALTGCGENSRAGKISAENGGTALSADVFTRKVGELEVSLLSERQQEGSPGILIGATPEILKKTAPGWTFPNAVNAFLVKRQTGDKQSYKLVDTGFGTKLFDNLKTLDVTAEKIDEVYLTHMHGDHIGGLLRADGSLAFPNAQVFLNKLEHDYWISLAGEKETPQSKVIAAYKKAGKLRVEEVGENWNGAKDHFLKESGRKPADVVFIQTYGHTPGHTAYLIFSKGERLLIWGDLAHAMAVQMPYPQVSVTYDVDPVQAAKSRQLVLDFITENSIPVAGMHIAYPGMGIITKDKEVSGSYKFEAFRASEQRP